MDYEKQISEVRTRIDTLDASLDSKHTPYLKSQLRFAGHLLDDAKSAIGHAAKADPNDTAMWHSFATLSIQHANQIWNQIREMVEKYGGPTNVREIG